MENKKKLKTLVLKKEQIVNLNDSEMQRVHGGTTWGCALASAAATLAGEILYDYGKEASWWVCNNEEPVNSEIIIPSEDGDMCQASEVVIYGLYTV